MPNILEVTYNFPCEVFINRHVLAMENIGYPVQLIARHASPININSASIQEEYRFNKQPIIMPHYDHLNTVGKISNLRYLLDFHSISLIKLPIRDRVVISFFDKFKPDLIHFHFGSLPQLMAWLPIELGIPYTVSLCGTDANVNPLLSKEAEFAFRNALEQSSGVHTVCNKLWDVAKRYTDKDIFHRTIYTPIPIPPYQPRNTIKGDIPHFVTVGRFVWQKNFSSLLVAFRQYIDHKGRGDLLIIGDGPESESLKYYISALGLDSHVKLVGKLSNYEIDRLLGTADAYIQSSISEGFSNSTGEAMASGVPVFATDVGGTSEVIINGENGFLLDPILPDAWWEKFLLVQDENLMQKISKNGWITAKEFFSAKKHAKKFLDFYATVLNAK